MTREEALDILTHNWTRLENPNYEESELDKAYYMAIEALTKPNYETDTEVRLAVTDRNKDKVILWDAFGEVEYYPHGEINEPTQTHGRLIDADALMEYCSNQKSKTINNNDIARFPTVQIADRPHGEWIEEYTDANGDKWYRCSHCGERFVLIEKGEASTEPYHFCPNCEADMRRKQNV